MTRYGRTLAFAVVLAAFGSTSFAQFGAGGMGGGRRGRSPDATASRSSDATSTPETQTGKVRDRLYDLRVRLAITPEQTALWQRFYDKVWDLSMNGALARAPAPDDQTAVQAVQQRAAEAQERASRLGEIGEAVVKLYAALTPDQQHIADQYLPPTLP